MCTRAMGGAHSPSYTSYMHMVCARIAATGQWAAARRAHLADLQLVQNGGLAGRIQPDLRVRAHGVGMLACTWRRRMHGSVPEIARARTATPAHSLRTPTRAAKRAGRRCTMRMRYSLSCLNLPMMPPMAAARTGAASARAVRVLFWSAPQTHAAHARSETHKEGRAPAHSPSKEQRC